MNSKGENPMRMCSLSLSLFFLCAWLFVYEFSTISNVRNYGVSLLWCETHALSFSIY
jgi:hypothetical protein